MKEEPGLPMFRADKQSHHPQVKNDGVCGGRGEGERGREGEKGWKI